MFNNKEYMKQYMKAYNHRPEVKEKKKEYQQRPEVKEKKKESRQRPEIKEQRKEYYKNNKEEIKEQRKEYYKNNKEEIKEKRREYYKNNKEKKNQYFMNRYNTDPIFKLDTNVPRSIRNSLKSNNLSKNGRHWEDLVGYTKEDLTIHLESLFTKGMNWDNYGMFGWHIDHIIPRSFFKYKSTDDVEFKYCWSLNNLQPLWAKENWRKGKSIK